MKRRLTLYSALFMAHQLCGITLPDYYRPALLEYHLRSTCDWMNTVEVNLFGGESSTSYNKHHNRTHTLNLYCHENIKDLAEGVPDSVLDKNPGSILNTLYTQTTGADFGTIAWQGSLEMIEWNVTVWQNLMHGFYLLAYIPFRSITCPTNCFVDFSTPENAGSANFGDWENFIKNLSTELRSYGVIINNIDTTGPADILLAVGWHQCYEDFAIFKYLHTDISFGITVPGSNKYNAQHVFNLTRGYGGFIAIPLTFELETNLTRHFSVGAYLQGVYFRHKTRCIGLKTALNQNGFIKLARGTVEIDRGAISTIGLYTKADHLKSAISIVIGYTYTQQQESDLRLCANEELFNRKTVNSDPLYKSWSFHQAHVALECDTSTCNKPWGPIFAFSYAIPLGGHRSMALPTTGASLSLSACLCF